MEPVRTREMQNRSLVDRLLGLPPRQLEMTPWRAACGVAALVAAAAAAVMFYYEIAVQMSYPDESEQASGWFGLSTADLFEFYVPAMLQLPANVLTLVDLFRRRRLGFGRGMLAFVAVWALTGYATAFYWIGEFRKSGRAAAMSLSEREIQP
jgi:hypothetical protein